MSTVSRIKSATIAVTIAILASNFTVLAHEGAMDVGYARLTATETDNLLLVKVEVLEPQPCDVFEADSLIGQRGDVSISASLLADTACTFQGVIELPEPGRWMISTRLKLDGQQADATMPVGVTGSGGEFETETWIHAIPASSSRFSSIANFVQTLALFGVVGVAVALLLAYAFSQRRKAASIGNID